MSTQQSAVLVPVVPAQRHAFGWPPGSVRALLLLIVVAMTCGLLLLTRTRDGRIIPIPPYLFYLLFLGIGYYFAARGHGREVHQDTRPPLWLPTGSIRFLIMGALTATVAWKMAHDPEGLRQQLEESARELPRQPWLPVVILAGFFAGVLFRVIVIGKHERSPWAQDLEAWIALIGGIFLCVMALIHLVINPTVEAGVLYLPEWESFVAGAVTFYFGIRS
jgi:hypothetical protein